MNPQPSTPTPNAADAVKAKLERALAQSAAAAVQAKPASAADAPAKPTDAGTAASGTTPKVDPDVALVLDIIKQEVADRGAGSTSPNAGTTPAGAEGGMLAQPVQPKELTPEEELEAALLDLESAETEALTEAQTHAAELAELRTQLAAAQTERDQAKTEAAAQRKAAEGWRAAFRQLRAKAV